MLGLEDPFSVVAGAGAGVASVRLLEEGQQYVTSTMGEELSSPSEFHVNRCCLDIS